MRRRKRHATIIATRFYKKKSSGGVLKQNQKLVILTVLLICGLILGALTDKKAAGTSAAPLREIIENYYQVKGEQSFLQNFLSTLGTESVYMGLALIFGVCAFGEPILWLLPLIKGLRLFISRTRRNRTCVFFSGHPFAVGDCVRQRIVCL